MKKHLQSLIMVGSLCLAGQALAGARDAHKIGLGFGILGDPVPSLVSYQVKFNLMNWLQLAAGYGSISTTGVSLGAGGAVTGGGSVTTYGASGKAFLLPSWDFSPFIGAGYAYTKITGSVSLSGSQISSSKSHLNVITAGGGLDWQAGIGFNIGAGVNYVLAPTDISSVIKMIPNFYLGWFF